MKDFIEKAKFGFKNNMFTVILGICNIIPMIICLTFWPDNVLLSLFIVPVLYRFICSFILSVIRKKGRPENIELFNTISRASIFIGFFILAVVSSLLGIDKASFIEIIILCVCLAFFDKILIFILKILVQVIFKTELPISSSSSSSAISVDSLISNAKTSFERPDGSIIYQDASGKTIGMSTYNASTKETTYWNESMKFIGTSVGNKGNEKFYDSKLNYKGQSEKDANGDKTFYDKDLNFKGKSRKNSNGTNTYHKN